MDSWEPTDTSDELYRCTRCGYGPFAPGIESCNCPAGVDDSQELPRTASEPRGSRLEQSTPADNSPDVDVAAEPLSSDTARRIVAQIAYRQFKVAEQLRDLSKKVPKVKRHQDLTILQAQSAILERTAKAFAEARKTAEAAATLAQASEEVELLDRREAMVRRLEKLQAGQVRSLEDAH